MAYKISRKRSGGNAPFEWAHCIISKLQVRHLHAACISLLPVSDGHKLGTGPPWSPPDMKIIITWSCHLHKNISMNPFCFCIFFSRRGKETKTKSDRHMIFLSLSLFRYFLRAVIALVRMDWREEIGSLCLKVLWYKKMICIWNTSLYLQFTVACDINYYLNVQYDLWIHLRFDIKHKRINKEIQRMERRNSIPYQSNTNRTHLSYLP